MIEPLFLLGPIILFFSLVIILQTIRRFSSIPILKLIFLSQFGFFVLTFNFFILILIGGQLSEFQFSFIHKMALVGGHSGIIIWFITVELIEYENISFNKLIQIRSIMIFTILSMIYNILSVNYEYTDFNIWKINYGSLGIIFLPIVYGSMFFSQYRLFAKKKLKDKLISSDNKIVKLVPTFYIIVCIFLVLTFIIGSTYPSMLHPLTWTIFASLAIFLFSILILKAPKIILTNEAPIYFSIISNSGTSLYSNKLSDEIVINQQIFGGYLSALNSVGTHVMRNPESSIHKIKFDKYNIVISSVEHFKLCYIYNGASIFASHKLSDLLDDLKLNNDLYECLRNCITENKTVEDQIFINTLNELVNKNIVKVSK